MTLAFLSIDRIEPRDAFFYIVAQFLGGWLGLAVATRVAFLAEFLISLKILFSLLQMMQQPPRKPWVGVVAGLHLWPFITFEAPLSGMS